MFLHLDCRHYRGDRPCIYKRLCEGCPHYTPMGPRVLLIKLGALGDVVRTGCLLPGLAKLDEPPFVTWLTAPEARPLVERMPGVHRVLTFGPETVTQLEAEHFDTVICLDKEPAPCALATRVQAEKRLGVGLSRYGTVYPMNEHCNDYFRLGLDNEEKFHRNQKTYPQLIYEALDLGYRGERYELELTEEDRRRAEDRLAELGIAPETRLVGLNPGAGAVFAMKAWRETGYVDLIKQLHRRRPELGFLLLGGPEERLLMERIATAAGDVPVYGGGHDHALGTFAGLIERCTAVVAGDTLAMHLGIGLGRPVVALFGPTCAQEIDLFGLGRKIVTPADCAPCYARGLCDRSPNCQEMIAPQTVLEAVVEQLDRSEAPEKS